VRILVCVASSPTQYVGALDSAYKIVRRPDDGFAVEWRQRGDVAREMFVDTLLQDDTYQALLMLDGDQRNPPNILEKLRVHLEAGGLDMVCAHYYRRDTKNVQSLCYELGDGNWPYMPYLDPPTSGLHEIAVTGFGCVLIHRRVFEAVKATLPYKASPVAIAPMPEVTRDYDNFGPDFRFFITARKLGFRLWLDAGVESLHGTTIWLGHKSAQKLMNYDAWASGAYDILKQRLELYGMNNPEIYRQRQRVLEARQRALMEQYDALEGAEPMDKQKMAEVSIALYEMNGRIKETAAYLEWAEKYPPITRPQELPTTKNTPAQELWQNESRAERLEGYRQQAQDLIAELPDAPDRPKPE